MINLLYLFLPGILILGVITSYTDIKYGKIRNNWIKFALIYALLMNISIIGYYYLTRQPLNIYYIIELITNFIIAAIIGFLIWNYGLWTAGDGKLFIAYAALIPLSVYAHNYLKYFPSFIVLINTFLPISIYLFVKLMVKSSLKQKKEVLSLIFNPKQLLSSAVSLFAVHWGIKYLFLLMDLNEGFFLRIIITIIVFSLLQKIFKKNTTIIMFIIFSLRLLIDKDVYSVGFLMEFSWLLVIWILFKSFVVELGSNFFTDKVRINDLEPGMIVYDNIVKDKYTYKKERKKESSKEEQEVLFKVRPEGITEEEIEKIKKLDKKKRLFFRTLNIQKTVPFAPFMFLGTALTIIAKGNILILIQNLI